MPIEARLITVLAKDESGTYATDPTPTVAANAVMPVSYKDDPNIAEVEKPALTQNTASWASRLLRFRFLLSLSLSA